jgi:hypothetical protein
MTTKTKLKTAIKRARSKLHKAKSDAKTGRPGTEQRVAHHNESLRRLTEPARAR